MLPFPNMPYSMPPSWCYPVTEICMYILFILCFFHALRQGMRDVGYLVGGLLFGLMLEYVNVIADMGYTYGKFMVMLGTAPLDIPLCIGVGWGVIMYASRKFSASFGLGLWSAAAMDTLLAISVDLGMDVVAYRLHMWHWGWEPKDNALTADWFGIPYGNFFGWLMVVFFYSAISRLLENTFRQKKTALFQMVIIPLLAVLLSQILLYVMLAYVDGFFYRQLNITALHRFIGFLVILIIMTAWGWLRRRRQYRKQLPAISWLVPLWFHLYFFAWLFIGGFYTEGWLIVVVSCINLLIGAGVHVFALQKKKDDLLTYPSR